MSSAEVAADPSREVPPEASGTERFDWNGWYVGGGMGLVFGSSKWSATRGAARASGPSGSLDLFDPIHFSDGTGSYFGELHAGYGKLIGSNVLLGLETAAMFPNTVSGAQAFASPRVGEIRYQDTVLASGSVRGRLGYVWDSWLLYGTG